MIDYHIHLERGPYSLEWLSHFWDQAQLLGVSEIGITEHAHKFREFLPVYEHLWNAGCCDPASASWIRSHFEHSLRDYLELLDAGENSGIPLKVGLEVDYFPQSEGEIGDLLSEYHFDYLLGSVHFLKDWSFDWNPEVGWPDRNVDDVYLGYLAMMDKMVKSNLFDVLAHLDVIKVFGHRASKNLDKEWEALLRHVSRAGLAIEVSTAGLRRPVGEIYPHPKLLKQAASLDIPITIASDAHMPCEVGYRWRDAATLAHACGYRTYSSFTGRKRSNHALPSF
ncbi:MAG TPA: histidinol-phosphatase [Firmicutes bacterium]|nr:histidinol-phosphatase [Bacillota bacterium]